MSIWQTPKTDLSDEEYLERSRKGQRISTEEKEKFQKFLEEETKRTLEEEKVRIEEMKAQSEALRIKMEKRRLENELK